MGRAKTKIIYKNWLLKTCIEHSVILENWPTDFTHDPAKLNQHALFKIFQELQKETIKYRKMTCAERESAIARANAPPIL